ncbi:hypothetical protein ABXN37_19690 [Piscinibacter sakaiensis]|uniref:Uncharacterized protein n=1 Tax=Piscinibacter sakaiensis TaxID=1547922 RepID=A0A0K8P471_PISS1|nr:hypothetical protein [Piscinibacter sakaiensis]GAP37349.1 hypothetical protein ISF6_3204 [Piscinibacter sakaiensis]
MSTVLYNCRRCKVGRRVEYAVGREGNGSRTWPFRRDEHGARQFPGAHLVARRRDGTAEYGGDPAGLCAGCGRPMAWGYLEAAHRPGVPCDARCTNARGFKCDCSCAGKNHGAGWGLFTGLAREAA